VSVVQVSVVQELIVLGMQRPGLIVEDRHDKTLQRGRAGVFVIVAGSGSRAAAFVRVDLASEVTPLSGDGALPGTAAHR
jgi:hypothetical protein